MLWSEKVNLKLILGSLAVAALLVTHWAAFDYGKKGLQVKIQDAALEAATQAREDEKRKQARINKGLQDQLNEKDIIASNLAADIERLHQRQSRRLSQAAAARCQGATGAQLSRPDANFLAGFASECATVESALKACYHYADALQD